MASACPLGAHAQFLSVDRCQTDDEVVADLRTPYQQAALRFVAALMKQDATEIQQQLTTALRRSITTERMSAALRQLAPLIQGKSEGRVAHSYLVTSRGSSGDHTVMCSALSQGSSAAMGDKVFASVTAAARQAHVIVEAENAGKTTSFAIWLVPDDLGEWLVHGFNVSQSTALGKTAADYRAMASEERQRGHFFNAVVLLSGAAKLANRGKYLQLALSQDIQKDWKALETPQELKGNPPFNWQVGSETFRVIGVEPTDVDGKLALMIRREVSSLTDAASVETESRRLIEGLVKKRPELRDVFDVVAVLAMEARSGRSFGTTETIRK